MPCYVSIYSLLYNNSNTDFEIFVISDEKDSQFFQKISSLEDVHDDFTITYVPSDRSKYDELPTPSRRWMQVTGKNYFGSEVYDKLAINELIPIEDENLLYLDADTIINYSLESLWEIDITEYAAAGVSTERNRALEFGLPWHSLYFNVGVLYINLKNWKKYDIKRKGLQYISENAGEIEYPSQDALNVVLHRENLLKFISPIYNAHGGWASQLARSDKQPIVIHYTSDNKPWFYRTNRHYKDIWWDYCEMTPYHDYKPADKNLRTAMKKWQNRIEKYVSATLQSYPKIHAIVAGIYNRIIK